MRATLTFYMLATAFPVAAETTAPTRVISSGDVMQWLLALCVVLATFAALIWLLRKTGGIAAPSGKTPLALLGGLSLGMRERLVLVKVGEQQLLLGVTPGRIEKLMVLEGEQRLFQNRDPHADDSSFAEKLQRIMQGHSHE